MNNTKNSVLKLYISPVGDDGWSGRLAEPNAKRTDGPLKTLEGFQGLLRLMKAGRTYNPRGQQPVEECLSAPITVYLREGVYAMRKPLVLSAEDSWPITIMPYRNEKPVISGGERITGWKTTTVNRKTAWVVELPEVTEGKWNFRQLFVNGRRAERPRLPKKGLFRMKEAPGLKLPAGFGGGGQTQFICNPGEAPCGKPQGDFAEPCEAQNAILSSIAVSPTKDPLCGKPHGLLAKKGEVHPFRNLDDVEVVYLHFWIEERSEIAAFDPDTNLVTMRRPSASALVGKHGSQLADYYLDNVFEELSEPGEWYLDRKEGRLYYLPRKGETPDKTEVIAPRCLQLLALVGKPEENRYIEHIRFEGIRFAYTDWRHPDASDGAEFIGPEATRRLYDQRLSDPWTNEFYQPDPSRPLYTHRFGRGIKAGVAQAACDVPGVIYFEGARFCAIEQCTIEHIGWYGVEIADACHGIRVVGNTIRDLGAGGVKINGAAARDPDVKIRQTGHHQVTDNEIAHGGRVFHSAIGVLSMHAHNVAICHNHIHDLFYSGISCGWEWGYQENISRDNLIAFNHIHDIGQKLLSDMGGIYTLGVQPGTILRNNLIHNVSSAHYGGWCIYPDEGSSHILIENNVCYDADRQPFHQHYGRENMVRNNIWVFGGEAVAVYTLLEPHRGFTWIRNIMVSKGEPFFRTGLAPEQEAGRILSDLNLFYAVKGKPYFEVGGKKLTLKQWQTMGRDKHSLVANPKFRNLDKRDLRLAADSPALKLGFVPIDLSVVGPRGPVGAEK